MPTKAPSPARLRALLPSRKLRFFVGVSDSRKTSVAMEGGSVAGRALVEGRVVHIPDVKADPEYTLLEDCELGDFRTVLGVPMLGRVCQSVFWR